MPTTSRGYVFPASTEHNRLWEHFENLAVSLNTDVGNVENIPHGKLSQPFGYSQAIAHNVIVALLFGTSSEIIDSHGYHSESVNASRVTPTKAGAYEVRAALSMAARADFTGVEVGVLLNGSAQPPAFRLPGIGNGTSVIQATTIVKCNGSSDYFEAYVRQSNGGSAATSTVVSVQYASGLEWKYLGPTP